MRRRADSRLLLERAHRGLRDGDADQPAGVGADRGCADDPGPFRGAGDPVGKRREIAGLEEQVSAPDLWDDVEHAQQVTSRLSRLQADVDRLTSLRSRLDDLAVLVELGQEEGDDASMVEADTELTALRRTIDALEIRTLLAGEYDERDALVTIRSEAGGVDAADFAEMLMRMYLRWAEQHDYRTTVLDTSYAEEAGIKSATLQVKGSNAYGWLKTESGVHRLVRISPYDSSARRHTSFASVGVSPVVDDATTGTTKPDAAKPGTAKSPRKPTTGGTTSGS